MFSASGDVIQVSGHEHWFNATEPSGEVRRGETDAATIFICISGSSELDAGAFRRGRHDVYEKDSRAGIPNLGASYTLG